MYENVQRTENTCNINKWSGRNYIYNDMKITM